MSIKYFEVRDRMTYIPVMAARIEAERNTKAGKLLRSSGYSWEQIQAGALVLVCHLQTGESHINTLNWGVCRTMKEAHKYIQMYYDFLETGAVIDIEFILDETDKPKVSQNI